jgi:hypothetical protein
MGKWILYGLILLNLFAFLWLYSNSEEDLAQPTQQPTTLLNSEKISIVKSIADSEPQNTALNQQLEQQPETLNQPIDSTEDPLQAIIVQTNPQQKLEEKTAPKQSESAQLAEQPKVQQPKVQQQQSNNQTLPKAVIESASQSAIQDPPTITSTDATQNMPTERTAEEQKLLDEMASFASNHEVASTTSLQTKMCYQYGPLNEVQADAIKVVMEQQQIPVVQQSRTLVEPRGFLVLILPQKNSNTAKSQMRSARKAGLDAFTITQGEWNNGVSLGIFSTKENADKFFKTVKGLIPNAPISIKKRVRESEVYRILFKLENEQDPVTLLSNNPFPSFNSKNPLQKTTKIAKKSCESVEF